MTARLICSHTTQVPLVGELENTWCVKVPVEAVPNVLSITGNFHLAVSGRDLDLKKGWRGG